ncbi:MAG TPA: gliding motility-associated C-terminal domain-containing protein, partial [Saprospiraceae bacterium]|nr:gliding motility-associated C-terminal domain-containing protein [Saprospiraceae bacterium]
HLQAGTYTVAVRDANGCTLTLPGGLTLAQPALFQVALMGSPSAIPGLPFPLHAEVIPAAAALQQIRWEPAALFPDPDRLQQLLSIQQSTLVRVTVVDVADCAASDSLYIGLDKSRFVYFPNVFHPEGPSLVENTRFTAYGSDAVARIRWMRVYDRWGNLIFENTQFPPNHPEAGWDGRHDGRLAPPGIYVWTAEVEYTDGERQQFQGEVGIVR